MPVIWDAGVNGGKITPSEFVRITSTSAAQIFNLYPRKGVVAAGADADLVVWDPEATKTISVKTQLSKGDLNVFEGRKVRGLPSHTVSGGRVVYAKGDVRAEKGAGRYLKRPAAGPEFDALRKVAALQAPVAVKR
jgi:dihydropyrimidinase